MRMGWVIGLVVLGAVAGACAEEGDGAKRAEVIALLRDYRSAPPGDAEPAVLQWNWTEEQKQRAAAFSTRQVIEVESGRALRLAVTEQMPWEGRESHRALTIGPALLPPTADAIRLRYRVSEGAVVLSFGGPTIYFGHSDVQTRPVTLTADGTDRWRTLEVPLHARLRRNFRRAGFAREAPVIYYTRWIQEPLGLYVHRGSAGVILIDRIELLWTGQGRPYPTFSEEETRIGALIADFDVPEAMERVFTAIHAVADFSGPPALPRPSWKPPKLSYLAALEDRRGVLRIEHQGAEETVFTGIRVEPAADANAIEIDLRATHPAQSLEELSIDFIAYSAPREGDARFDWARFAPPAAWRDRPDLSFDYYLGEPAMRNVTHAAHHARRAVPNGRWVRLIIPLADFVCIYGAGDMAEALKRQQPIDAQRLIAIGLLPSWRQHSHATTFEIDRIRWVSVPGNPASLRSFPQVNNIEQVQLVPVGPTPYGVMLEMTGQDIQPE